MGMGHGSAPSGSQYQSAAGPSLAQRLQTSDSLLLVVSRDASRRVLRDRNMVMRTRPTTVVNQARRLSTSLVSVRPSALPLANAPTRLTFLPDLRHGGAVPRRIPVRRRRARAHLRSSRTPVRPMPPSRRTRKRTSLRQGQSAPRRGWHWITARPSRHGRPSSAGGFGWRCRRGRGRPCRCRRSGRWAPG
jgi:hypothetical protein